MTTTIAAPQSDADQAAGPEHFDVLIVGAGVSGIGAAHHFQQQYPDRSFVIVDAQDQPGGTWRTHSFPGIRSDSDLFTYGYRFKPWRGASIAAGEKILDYLDEVIEDDNLDPHIRYGHRVTAASWSSEDRRWTVETTRKDTGEKVTFTAGFLWMCQGYYNHDEPYTPEWKGMDTFQGQIIHPQAWPDDLDYTGKRIVVIGSGSTAGTLIPALAQKAEHVTMLQRSPSYYFPRPLVSDMEASLRPLDLPEDWMHEILRRQYQLELDWLAHASVDTPDEIHTFLMESIKPLLPEGFDVEKHLTPTYRPWQQRIVIVPDGDLFAAIRDGMASIATDTIDEFVANGIKLGSGEVLEADIIVTATGFNLSCFGDIPFSIDGEKVDFTKRVTWRGLMISGVPNMAYWFGYFRHSWTLRVDLVSDVVERIMTHMDEKGASVVTPTLRPQDADMPLLPWVSPDNFNAGYVVRSQDKLFKQGDREPWIHMLEHAEELAQLPNADLDDGLAYS